MSMAAWAKGKASVAFFLILLMAQTVLGLAHGAEPLVVPPFNAMVTDLTGTLSSEQQGTLEQRLNAFQVRKGAQIAVLIVDSTLPESIEQYALRVAEQWKLGRADADDGLLLLVAKQDRALRIEVGYGLEGVINDATARRVISEYITPKFRDGDYFGGISAGIERLIALVDGEPLPAVQTKPDLGGFAPVLLLITFAAGGLLRSILGRLPGALLTSGAVGVVAWFFASAWFVAIAAAAIAFFITLIGGLGGGGFGGRGRGGFGGGSGGMRGGGFGGGGGGGFGGGGASGRW